MQATRAPALGSSGWCSSPCCVASLINPSSYCFTFLQGLQIELEVVNNYDDCVLSGDQYSTLWSITEPQIKCDVVTLDNQLDNEYTDHLM